MRGERHVPVGGKISRASNHDNPMPALKAGVDGREVALARREAELERQQRELGETRRELEQALERVSGLSAARAKQMLLKEIEDQAKHDAGRRLREIEEETKRDAERRVRNILSVCMQRLAAGNAGEPTGSVAK